MFKKLARIGMILAAAALASTTFALAETSATPAPNVIAQESPAPEATPSPFTYKGFVRGFYFTRQNASSYPKGVGAINQASFNAAISLHGQYRFQDSGISAGATYLYAYPFSTGCSTAATISSKQCTPGKTDALNPDNTLPPFELSTLYEAYLQYQDKTTYAKVGDQVINTPWANPSDSRLKPVAFQGADVTYKFTKAWTGELSYYDGFEDRVSSQFFRSTLLTYNPYDTPGQKSLVNVNGSTNATMTTNNGFFYGRLGYTGDHGLTGDLDYYSFSDIANFFWFDARQTFTGKLKPFVAAQFGSEKDTGAALVGKIDSTVFGLQGGVSVTPNVSVTLAYNDVPAKSATVALAPGSACPANHVLPANKGVANYFVANGGPDCVPAPSVNGLNYATVYYGGIASPYTDSYATDPLFTTSISQGMADRRYFGQAGKLTVNFVSNNRRLVALISRALYSYGNAAVGVQPTQETNIDATYFFSPVPKTGAYRGFLIRHRYAERTTDYTTAFGGVPLFKYNRTQLEYDF